MMIPYIINGQDHNFNFMLFSKMQQRFSLIRFITLTITLSLVFTPIFLVYAEELEQPANIVGNNVTTEQPEAEQDKTGEIKSGDLDEPKVEDITGNENDRSSDMLMSSSSSTTDDPKPDQMVNNKVGKARVDDYSGSLVFDVPINLPNGRDGLNSELSLIYNSSNLDHNSILSSGWSFNIPYIERVNKKGVEKIYSDSFFSSSISGELVEASTNQFQPKTQNSEFIDYSFDNNTWVAATKNGTVYKFGSTSLNRLDNPLDATKVSKWMIDEIRDTNNNYIKYEYFKDSGQIYPSKIIYTGKDNTDGIFSIDFSRESRLDVNSSYKSGFLVKTDYRVKEISININNVLDRKYTLGYGNGDNGKRSLLTSITEEGKNDIGETTSKRPWLFSYSNPNNGVDAFVRDNNWNVPVVLGEGVVITEVNGDGLSDFIQSYNEFMSPHDKKGVYYNNGDGSWTHENLQAPEFFLNGGNTLPDGGVRESDFTGDGIGGDLVRHIGCGQGAPNPKSYLFNDGVWTEATTGWISQIEFACNNSSSDTGSRLLDINGDGLPDMINSYRHSGTNLVESKIYLNDGTGWVRNFDWSIPSSIKEGVYFAELNGDGLVDYLQSYQNHSSSPKAAYINNGHGSWELDVSLEPPMYFYSSTSSPHDHGVRLADLNGDGLTDISQSLGWVGIDHTYLNTGSGWLEVDQIWDSPEDWADGRNDLDTNARLADFSGDGLPDVLESFRNSNGQLETNFYLNNKGKADYLNQIIFPDKASSSISYQASPLYKTGTSLDNPDMPFGVDTVKSITTNDSNGTTTVNNYVYQGGKYYYNNAFDRKFSGFNIITSTDAAGNVTKTYYHQGEHSDHISKAGKPYRIEQLDSSGNVYSTKINKWENYSLGNDAYFVKLTQELNQTFDGNTSHKDTATSYTYNNTTGNLTQKIDWGEVSGANDGTFSDTGTDKFTTDITYATGSTLNVIGLPSDETTIDINSAKIRQTRHYYDGLALGSIEKGNETKTEHWKSGSSYINTQKTYNSYGLVTQELDPRGKSTTYNYDTHNLYPATVTNHLNHTTSYLYDYSLGKPKQVTDPNGFVYQTVYDGLDRVVEEKQPDLVTPTTLVTKSAYTYTDQTVGQKIQKTDYLDASNSVDSYTYTDGLGRPIQTRTEAEDSNTFVITDKIYNNIGQLHKESLPYFSSGSSKTSPTTDGNLLITYTYDPAMRVVSIQNAVGTVTNAYEDWKLTTTDAKGKLKNLYKDARGNLVKVEEINSGNTYTTNYEYNGNNNLTKITDALGNIRNFVYDGLGRRTSAQDLHAASDASFGTWTYTYDDSGNLITTLDPKAQTINYTYDDINRKLTENFAGQAGVEISQTYDTAPNGIGYLASATSIADTSNYQYNALGGVKQESKVITAVTYTTAYTYDRQGNEIEIVNPDNSKVKYSYNTAGQLEAVQRKESTDGSYLNVVTDFDYGPHGKVTYQANANGTATTNTYDATKLYRMSNKLTTGPGTGGTATTVTFYPTSGDGYVYNQGTSWATIRAATTGTAASATTTTSGVIIGKVTSTEYQIFRGFLPFDTSSLPDGAVIENAQLKIYVEGKANTDNDGDDWITVVQGSQASTSTLAAADFDAISSSEGIYSFDRKDITDVVTGQYLSFNLSPTGKSWISKTGVSKFALREGHDHVNSAFTGTAGQYNYLQYRSSEYAGTATDPVLEVTYYTAPPATTTIQDVDYTYDANGNITQIVDASGTASSKTVDYTYDDLNRLLSATATNVASVQTPYAETYTYDAIGNITSKTGRGNYAYDGHTGTSHANPHAATAIGSTSVTYDNNGNITSQGILSFVWYHDNKLKYTYANGSVLLGAYTYDHTGYRNAYYNVSGVTTLYPTKHYNTTGTVHTKHIFAGDVLVATVNGTGAAASASIDHTDHLTGSSVVTNSSGALLAVVDYYPYGTLRYDWKYDGYTEQRKYAGHEYDAETGLSNMGARYYNGLNGKFMSQDPVYWDFSRLQTQLLDPQSWNSYAYGRNNPIKHNDPDGQFWDTVVDVGFTVWDGHKVIQHSGQWLGDQASIGLGKVFGNERLENNGRQNSAVSGAALKNSSLDLTIDVGATLVPGVPAFVGKIDNLAPVKKFTTSEMSHANLEGYLSKASDTKLRNTLTKNYQSNDTLPGGTAGAVKHELMNYTTVGGKSHYQKASVDQWNAFRNVLSRSTSTKNDISIAQHHLKNLFKSLTVNNHKPNLKR